MKTVLLPRPAPTLPLTCALLASFTTVSPAITVLSDDFTGTNGTNVAGTTPEIGGQWQLNQGEHPVFAGGSAVVASTNVGGGSPWTDLGASFTSTLSVANPVMLVTIDISAASYTYAPGAEFDAMEIYFEGGFVVPAITMDQDYGSLQWHLGTTPVPGLVGAAVATLSYNYNTGLTQIFAGTDNSGPALASVAANAGIGVNGMGFYTMGGGVLAVNSVNVQFIPEPSSLVLTGMGLAGLCLRRRVREIG